MKRQVFFLIVSTVLLASCQREQDWCGAPDINAKVESEQKTRTSLSVDGSGAGTIYWNPTDRIDVFFGSTKASYTSQNATDAITAVFKTSDSVSGADITSSNIWGLYPSNSSSSCDGNAITTTLPATQYGVPNTFDKDIFPAVAHSSSTNLQFYNVCGGIKFNLAYDDIKMITFRGNNNENLAGTVSISFVDDLPKATIVNGVKEITLTPKTGTTFTKGADYYFILLPVTLSAGFTMTFTATDGTTGILNYTDNPVSIKRSIFGKKKDIDVYGRFGDLRQANNVIYYTSADDQIVTPYLTDGFGANIISNEYVDGRGVIVFDGDVTSIGEHSFWECRNLVSIEIPISVTTIGSRAFYLCSGLVSFIIPNSVITIGFAAFESCLNLRSVSIPSSVMNIHETSFFRCPGLISICVDDGNPIYDSRNNCNAIIETKTNKLLSGCKNTIIPNSVLIIGEDAFHGCHDLLSIDIPDSVTSIGNNAFWECYSLNTIEIPSSVINIESNPFGFCDDLASIFVQSGNTKYDSRDDCNAIIETNTNKLVSGCKNTIVPNSVSVIGYEAFIDCDGLTSITIPNSVTRIENYAFQGCSGLTEIEIPSSVISIGNGAFASCYLRFFYDYSPVPQTLGGGLFSSYAPIYVPAESVDLYKSADNWSNYADRIFSMDILDFSGIPDNVIYYTSSDGNTIIPNVDVFDATIVSNEYESGRGVITFDGAVTSIGKSAFSGSYRLTSICIPNTITSIGDGAFSHCNNLGSIEIPISVTSIGTNPFEGCYNLESIIVQSGNPVYDSRNGCNAIIKTDTNELVSGCKKTVIPNSVSIIGTRAFSGIRGIESIIIPNSVISIKLKAFSSAGLTSVVLPTSLSEIDQLAFEHCNFTSIEIPSSVTSIGYMPFSQCPLNSIHVQPGNSKFDSRDNCNAIIETNSNTLIVGCKNTLIPNTITAVGDFAFNWCRSLSSTVIPNSVTRIGYSAFTNCRDLNYVLINKDCISCINERKGNAGCVVAKNKKILLVRYRRTNQISLPGGFRDYKHRDTFVASEEMRNALGYVVSIEDIIGDFEYLFKLSTDSDFRLYKCNVIKKTNKTNDKILEEKWVNKQELWDILNTTNKEEVAFKDELQLVYDKFEFITNN